MPENETFGVNFNEIKRDRYAQVSRTMDLKNGEPIPKRREMDKLESEQ